MVFETTLFADEGVHVAVEVSATRKIFAASLVFFAADRFAGFTGVRPLAVYKRGCFAN